MTTTDEFVVADALACPSSQTFMMVEGPVLAGLAFVLSDKDLYPLFPILFGFGSV